VTLAVGGEREVAEEGQTRLCGLDDSQVVRFADVPVVGPVAHWKRRTDGEKNRIHTGEAPAIYDRSREGYCWPFVCQGSI
jgi:hypothetical protein